MEDYRDEDLTAFQFYGSWREYAPIAFTNLLLTIVTLGFYRFWATTRSRKYLWGQTRFIDDRLEWTGTGKELFIGFVMAIFVFFLPLLLLNWGFQALMLRGMTGPAMCLLALLYATIMYVTGLARFRALRYRLSRTYWHGIRGGSDDGGWRYGVSAIWKTVVGLLPLWLLVPWSMVSLWNERWRKMSFGPHTFTSDARAMPIFKVFLLFYLSPILIIILAVGLVGTFGGFIGNVFVKTDAPPMVAIVMLFVILIGVYMLLGLIALAYYAAYLREGIGNLKLGGVSFEFEATTSEWLNLFLVDVLLVVGTLGIGWIFLTYRHWKFFITHLEATGEIDLEALTQSKTRELKQGEGLLDAFDVGAI
jgi:uncharacterized membrane protein YjgN (DUF898 family)